MNNQYQKDNMAIIDMATDGVQLTNAEKHTLEHIAISEDRSTVENVASVIAKAKKFQRTDNNKPILSATVKSKDETSYNCEVEIGGGEGKDLLYLLGVMVEGLYMRGLPATCVEDAVKDGLDRAKERYPESVIERLLKGNL